MAVLKCKICGGSLELDGSLSVTTCQYCGTKQTLPKFCDERRANLYDRANHFRRNNEFDKAMAIYENILNEDNTDAEAYWSIVLCSYGIEYVEDAATKKRVPTVNRAQFTSIFDDENYKSAIANADEYQREMYEAEAAKINEIQKGILAISQNEEPFDVFICYKDTDANGRRTQDSVIATELYHGLTKEGFKVFFSRITLEDKLGIAYEPYIFAALNSAKVMVVLGTRPEHFNAVWVKNEWSRYLALIKNGAKKTLIPAYRDMDPYDLPEEFSHLQGQDMAKLGFMQDLVRGIKKIVTPQKQTDAQNEPAVINADMNVESVFKRVYMALEDGKFARADAFCEQILNQNPRDAEAYVCKLLAELRIRRRSELSRSAIPFENSNNYQKALLFGSGALKNELYRASQSVIANIDNRNNDIIYRQAKMMLDSARDIPACKQALAIFLSISGYLDSEECIKRCQEKIGAFQEEWDRLIVEQQKREEERKKRAKRSRILGIIFGILSVLLLFGLLFAYVYVFHIVIPDRQYNEALTLIEEKKYDEASELLTEAREFAFKKEVLTAIDSAFSTIESARTYNVTMTEVKSYFNSVEQSGKKDLSNEEYENKVRALLKTGASVNIVYDCDGGSLIVIPAVASNDICYTSQAAFKGICSAKRDGYAFDGWTYVSSEDRPSKGNFRITLKARWTKNTYSIRYELAGGTMSGRKVSYTIDDTFVLPTPKRTGYTFVGWTGTDIDEPTLEVTVPKGSFGSRTYTANWTVDGYKVFFDSTGGSCEMSEAGYAYGSFVVLPIPTRTGYTFDGWYNGNERVDDGKWTFLTNIKLTAKWKPITYQINYYLGGVTADHSNPITYTIESNEIVLLPVYHDNATFLGWYTDSELKNAITSIPKGTNGDINLYAKWDLEVFTIEYDLHGGKEASTLKTTFTVVDLPLNLSTSQKDDHTFYYWAKDELDGEPVREITACQNYKLVANYIPAELQIRRLSGGARDGYWVDACYSGDATDIEIPKYHMLGYYSDSPYIQTITLMTARNLSSISFSDEIIEIDVTDKFQFNVYENGNYVGSRNNPYHSLVGRADPSVPIKTIHRDTVYIDANVFSGDITLTSIVIPEKIKYIDSAFGGCYNLVEVYNLSSLNIQVDSSDHGGVAYYAEVVHTSLDEPSRVSQQGEYMAYYDAQNSLYKILIYLGDDAEIVLPNDINGNDYTLGSYVFYERSDIKSIILSEGMVGLGSHTFYGCSGLTSISLPSKITHIGSHTFYDCFNLVSITIPQNLIAFDTYSFYGCSSLRSITLPPTLTKIGTYTFSGCEMLLEVYNLSSLNLEKLESESGYLTFYPKVIHTSLDEPSCWITQDDYIFFVSPENDVYLLCGYTGNESVIVLPNNISGHSYGIHAYAFAGNTQLTDITVSDGVIAIDSFAFANCSSLKYVYIGKDVSSIQDRAFDNCPSLISADFADTTGWELYHYSSSYKVYTASELEDDTSAANILRSLIYLYMNLQKISN